MLRTVKQIAEDLGVDVEDLCTKCGEDEQHDLDLCISCIEDLIDDEDEDEE